MILTKTCDFDLDHVGETPDISAPRVFNQLILVGGLDHFCDFSIYWECHHPNWRTHIFQRGRSTTNQYISIALLSIGNVMVKMGTKTNTGKPLNFRSGTTSITVNPQCICLETDTFVLLPSPELVGFKERRKIAGIIVFFFPWTSMDMTYCSFQNLHGSLAANVWIFCRQRKRPSPIWAVRHTAGALFGIKITLLKYLLTILWTVNKHLPNQFVWPTWNKPENYYHILIDMVCTIVHAQRSQYDQSKIRLQHDHLVEISPYIKIITLTYMA